MTSKNSINNPESMAPGFGSLLKEALRRQSVLMILSVLGSFLASPVYYLYYLGTRNIQYTNLLQKGVDAIPSERQSRELLALMLSCLRGHQVCHTAVLMAGAVLVAFVGFRHLFNRRMTDLYHSVPVTRDRQFLAQYLAGFLIWFVPFLTGDLIVLIGGCIRCAGTPIPSIAGEYAVFWLKTTFLCILGFLIVYHLALLAVMLSGNVFNAIANLLLSGLFAGMVYFLRYLYGNRFLDTFVEFPKEGVYGTLIGFTPLLTPAAFCKFLSDGTWTTPDQRLLLLCSGALCLVNFALAMFLHHKRRSEAAEGGMDSRLLRILFRFVISLLCGLVMALLFSHLVKNASSPQAPWIAFGGILGSVITFCAMNVVYHANFKALFAHKIQMLLSVVTVCCIALITRYDALGYDTYVPKESDITGISLVTYGNIGLSYRLSFDADGNFTDMDRDVEEPLRTQTFSTDPALIHNILSTLAAAQTNDSSSAGNTSDPHSFVQRGTLTLTVNVRVDTKHGSYFRTYAGLGPAEMEALSPILHSETYRDTFYPANTGQFPDPDQIALTDLQQKALVLTDKERIRELYQAYTEDFKEQYASWHPYYSRFFGYLYSVHFYYHRKQEPSFGIDLNMWDNFDRTTALLQEWYPEYIWRGKDLDISRLELYLLLPEGFPLAEYLGLTQNANGNVQTAYELQDHADDHRYYAEAQNIRYVLTLQQPDLSDLRPYLCFASTGLYYDKDHVYIGHAYVNTVNGEENYRCYLELGKMPQELFAKIYADGANERD
ncbi:MAG: hypothetical protein IJ716_03555 [Lachnospiraceae bacterium]|nr:hypothetical protein [Lachnospiraceae bacterium]